VVAFVVVVVVGGFVVVVAGGLVVVLKGGVVVVATEVDVGGEVVVTSVVVVVAEFGTGVETALVEVAPAEPASLPNIPAKTRMPNSPAGM